MLSLDDLQRLADRFSDCLDLRVREFDIGGRPFAFNARPHLMGVVNLSPDSWYRESVCLTAEQAIRRGRRLAAEGADLVDVGAESTLAHAARVDATEQTGKLSPVISGLKAAGIPVSAETYDLSLAKACLETGASVLNLTGTTRTEDIFRLVAEHRAAVILCYVEGEHVRAVGDFSLKDDMIPPMQDYFARKIEEATRLGVERIILDPGLGFYYRNLRDSADRVRRQMRTFLNTFRLRKLGWPVCHALPHAFEYFGEEVRCAEPFFATLALLGGTDLIRTHEIAKVRGVVGTLEAWPSKG